ncbi:MAG TPA: NUDIX hydrolase, partial [Cupriavidus sp.]|nr:NUDIX hydrolase [Cupriavidus sp.]
TLVNATRRILQSIAHFQNAQTCFDFAQQQRNIPLVMPRLASGPKGQRPVMPEEAPYAEISRIDPDGAGHGRYALEPGHAVKLSDRVWRVTANNGSVMT